RSMKVLMIRVSWPCRRRAVAAMRRAKPRSLAASARYSGRERLDASASSNVRPWLSTAAMRSTASARACRPVGCLGDPERFVLPVLTRLWLSMRPSAPGPTSAAGTRTGARPAHGGGELLQLGDPVLGVGVSREQVVHTLTR